MFVLSLLASELVDWFVSSGEADSRSRALELGQLLVNTDYIHHVVDEHNFEDAYLFFRFRQDGELSLSFSLSSFTRLLYLQLFFLEK